MGQASERKPSGTLSTRRIRREKRTIAVMIDMYCRTHHDGSAPPAFREPEGDLCADCAGLRRYAFERIDHCPFCTDKPTCVNCPIHCYRPEMRERVRQVMRWAGPRMMTRHPWLAVMHLIDGRRRVEWPRRRGASAGATGRDSLTG